MVNIYNEDGEVIGTVKYNNNLDEWNGRNWQNGGTGLHLGITKVSNGSFVLIHSSDWQGSKDWAEIVPNERAFKLIMRFGPELLEEDKFKELNKFKKEMLTEVE